MMSKIKSSKLAIAKISLGVLVAAVLVIAFACEQKEVVGTENITAEQTIVLSIGEKQIIITGDDAMATVKGLLRNKILNINISEEDNITYMKLLEIEKVVTSKDIVPEKLETSEVFFIVEDMPEFPGGEYALREYISKSVKYPEIAQKNGIQGKVYVTFVVTKDGNIANAAIARGVDPVLDNEALRVVNSLPKWKPGKQRGQAVNVSFTVPINFALQ